MKNVVFAFSKWPPGLDLHVVFYHEVLRLVLLVERMSFNLIDGRNDLVMNDQVYKPVLTKIDYAYCSDFSFFVQVLHCPPFTIHITIWLMHQVQVEVI